MISSSSKLHFLAYYIVQYAMLLCLCLYGTQVPAQSWSPFVNNFNTEDFNAALPNIAVQQDATGLVFIGNLSGLLIYDGHSWDYRPIENGSMINQLYISENNQIYFASNNKFGYLGADLNGEIGYHLISNDFPSLQNSRIKGINQNQFGTYFLSEEYIFQWKNDNLFNIPAGLIGFQKMFSFNDKLFIKERGQGLKTLNDRKFSPLNNSPLLIDHSISTSFQMMNNLFMISFQDIQFYSMNDQFEVKKEVFPFRSEIQKALPYRALYSDSIITFSTRKNGVIFIDTKDTSRIIFNEKENLSSNITVDVNADSQNAIWVTSQNGVSRVEPNKAWSDWNSGSGLSDIVANVKRHKNTIYVSTTKGVFYYKNQKWHKIANYDAKAFYFVEHSNELYVSGSEQGLLLVNESQINPIKGIQNVWVTTTDEDGNLYIPSEKTGLLRVSKNFKNEPLLLNSDLNGTSISFKFKNDSSAWLSMKWEGLYLLNIAKDTATYTLFNQKHGLPDVTEINIIPFHEDFIFTTSKGFYQVNPNPKSDSSDFFIPFRALPETGPVSTAAVDDKHNIWYATKNHYGEQELRKLVLGTGGNYTDASVPLKRLPNQTINQIYPDPAKKGVIWIAGSKGLYRYDENIPFNTTLPFNTFIRKVSSGDSIIFHGYYTVENKGDAPSFVREQPKKYIPKLAYASNNIKLQFSSSAYTLPERNEYSYYLKGVDQGWSKWSRTTQKEYSNLSPGTYTFQLKCKNLYGTLGAPTSYTFTIIPPWYLTTWAKVLFILIGLAVIWFIIMLYSYRLRLHRKHLKMLVADRTFEVMAQKKELEKQYKQLSEQTEEMLLQSEQIELKNKDLEQHQEEILTINNKLEEMNAYLEKKVEKRTAKIKSTLDKLKQTNKELDTFIYKASHDLKGPLSRILGLSSLAKIETPSEKNIQYLDMIERTSRDMDLLLSKLTQVHEIFNQKPKIVPLLIEEILEDVKIKLRYLHQKNGALIELNNQVNSPIQADHQLFYTVIYNIIENAMIFTNPELDGKHLIQINLEATGQELVLTIKDNGVGIEEEQLDAIFDMFYRASDQSKGSGLGLYLVKIAIDKMHGKVSVKSQVEVSTTFTIKLPI